MKFIHTADWHLGNRMHDLDRKNEFLSFLKWLKDTIISEKAQALVIAGDIFDTANPSTDARAMYIQFLASLLETDCNNVIIVGGNHDSGSLLDSEKPLLELLNIHVVGSVANLQAKDMVFELKDKNGNVTGICGAVPFARENELRNFFDNETEDGNFSDKAYSALYNSILAEAKIIDKKRNLPLIVTGHLYAADLEGRFSDNSLEIDSDDGRRKLDVIGKLGSVHVGVFPDEFNYVALGHIHYSTMVGKNPKVRYSGSPFTLGFDEAGLPRHVLSVCIEKNNASGQYETIVDKVKIPQNVTYRRISGDFKSIFLELDKFNSIEKNPVYLEICYKVEEGKSINDQIDSYEDKLEKLNVHIISKRPIVINENISSGKYLFDSKEIKNLAPEEIFKAAILSTPLEDFSELDDIEKQKRQEEILNTYLPLFLDEFSKTE